MLSHPFVDTGDGTKLRLTPDESVAPVDEPANHLIFN